MEKQTLNRGLFLLFLLLSALSWAESSQQHHQRIEELRKRVESLKSDLKDARTVQSQEQAALEHTEKEIAALSNTLYKTENAITAVTKKHQQLEDSLGPIEASIATQHQLLRQQIQASYRMGRKQRLKMLLQQNDRLKARRVINYYRYLSQARTRLIKQIQQDFRVLLKTADEIRAEEKKLSQLKIEQQQLLGDLRAVQKEHQLSVAKWQQHIEDTGIRLKTAEQDIERLQQLTQKLVETLAPVRNHRPSKPFNQRRGKLPWPVRGAIVQAYGVKLQGEVIQEGVVIETKIPRKVKALHDGEVIFADHLRGYGLLLIIDHGNGYMTVYGYNETLFKDVGDTVSTDEVISISGVSGGRSTPALYFAIRHNTKPQNPLNWCVKRKS